jgi:hypothetical protein
MKNRLRNSWLWDKRLAMPTLAGFIAGALTLIAVVFAAAFWISVAVESASCNQFGERVGAPAHYRILTGCYVELADGRMVPDDRYPALHVEVDGAR